jgi:hypothetical protein
MKRKPWPVLVLCLVLLSAAPTLADGDIYAGGPWGTKITSLPYEIKIPGAYYLGGDLTYTGSGNGITIDAGVNHVTLDLMGFTLNGSGNGRYGIYLNGSKNVEIRNGTLTGWQCGIREPNGLDMLHRIINVRAVDNGIGFFLSGSGHLVKGCEVTATGTQYAIYISPKSTVSACIIKFVYGYGIYTNGGIFSDNVITGTGTGSPRYGIYTSGNGALIKGNKVSGCAYGIYSDQSGLNVIGNTVDAASGTTGVYLPDDYSTLLDQNTVTGAGTHYNAAYTKIYQRSNY